MNTVSEKVALLKKGKDLLKNREYEQARFFLQEILKKNPNAEASFYNLLGACFMRLGDMNSAIMQLTIARELGRGEDYRNASRNMITVYLSLAEEQEEKQSKEFDSETKIALFSEATKNLKKANKILSEFVF